MTEEYRDPKTGFCVKAALNEPGEAIGRVQNRAVLTEYLHSPEATEKKLLRDVFVKEIYTIGWEICWFITRMGGCSSMTA